MNDPGRRRSPDGFDDDAIFADIVAHLSDDVAPSDGSTEDERTARLAADAPTTDIETTDVGTADKATEETTSDSTDLPPGDGPRADPAPWPGNQPAGPPTLGDQQAIPAPQGWRAQEAHDEYEEHFEPPPVTPLPAGDLTFWAIIAGMGGGPLLLLYFVFFNRDASSYWILAAIAMSIAGFALLVSRMPGPHEDDDDGARL
jgi:hypothetical protein